jgi:hypothetical protein
LLPLPPLREIRGSWSIPVLWSRCFCRPKEAAMANLTNGFASLHCAGAMHVDKGHMQASGLPFLSFRRCTQLDISRWSCYCQLFFRLCVKCLAFPPKGSQLLIVV